MSTELHELPEVGEIVIATVTKIGDHGAYVNLDEYNNIQGFLHISEIAQGWVRSVGKFVKEGEKKVLLVKKVREGREEIDLSLKQISRDQKKKKLLDVKRYEKGKGIIKSVQEKTKLSGAEIENLEDKIFSKYDSIYDAVVDIARRGIGVLNDLKLPKKILDVIVEEGSKIKLPSAEILGVLEITDTSSNGIENIKKKLQDLEKKGQNGVVISYIGAPKYRVSIIAQEFKTAEKIIKPILEKIEKDVKKQNGTFNFTREESKKTGGG